MEVVDILTRLGFVVIRIKGSHYRLRYAREGMICYVSVPIHGSTSLPIGTLKSIYRQASSCIPENELKAFFYVD
jgi:predicted RNA binding protein YcfA (HicA-like mRNA interferase family)